MAHITPTFNKQNRFQDPLIFAIRSAKTDSQLTTDQTNLQNTYGVSVTITRELPTTAVVRITGKKEDVLAAVNEFQSDKKFDNNALEVLISIDAIANDTIYSVTVDGKTYSILSAFTGATAVSIRQQLLSTLNVGFTNFSAVEGPIDSQFILKANLAGTIFTYSVSANMSTSEIESNVDKSKDPFALSPNQLGPEYDKFNPYA